MKQIVFGIGVIGVVAACQMPQMPGPADGARLFSAHCAACHGSDAKGAGPETLGIGAIPPDLTTLAARNGGAFPRAAVLSTIDGYVEGSHPGRVMPEFGADLGGDLVPVEVIDPSPYDPDLTRVRQ